MKAIKNVLYTSLLFLTIQVNAQDQPKAFSISESIQYARENSSRIKISKFDEEIAQKQIKEIKGSGLPQANVNGTFEDRLKLPLLILPDMSQIPGMPQGGGGSGEGIPLGYQYNTSLVGEVTQMIYNPSFWVGLKAAKSSTRLSEQATEQVTEETAYNVAASYYQAIVAGKQLQLLRTNLENTQKILATTQLQFENGVAKLVDVNRLKVSASNLESRVRQAEVTVEQAEDRLKYQMGMPLTEEIVLVDTSLTFAKEDVEATVNIDQFLGNRLDYQILQTNLDLENLNRKNINSGYQPTLFAYGNYGYQAQGPELHLFKTKGNEWVDYTTASIGLRLRIPIFDGFQRNAQSQQSRIRGEQLEEQMEFTKQSIALEISNAEKQFMNTIDRIEAEQANVELAEQVYEVTQLEFREGVGTSTAVVESETSLREAQNTYVRSLLDLYTARLDLEKAKGNLINYIGTN